MFFFILSCCIIFFLYFNNKIEFFKNSDIDNQPAYCVQLNNLENKIEKNIINKINDIYYKINDINNNMEKIKNSEKKSEKK